MATGQEFGFGFKLTLNDQLTNSLKTAAAGINQFSGQFNGFISLVKYATSALVGFYATSRVIQQIRQLLYFGQDLEQKQVQLQALTGSLKEARGLFEFARKKAEQLPFGSITEILGAIKAMNLFGFSAQKHFDAIAGLAAVSGESLESVVYNLNFFTQSGFARGLARMGVNVKELQKATHGLRAGTDEFREATIKFIGSQEKFKNAVSVQRNTLAGLRDDIQDVFEAFKLDIIGLNKEGGLLGGYKRFLRQIRNFLVEHKEGLKQIAVSIGRVLGGVFDILGQAFTRMTKSFGGWIDSTGNMFKTNQDLITQFLFWIGLIELRIEGIMKTAWEWMNKIADALGGWKAVSAGLAVMVAGTGIATLGSSMVTLASALGLSLGPMALLAANLFIWSDVVIQWQHLKKSMSDMTWGEIAQSIGYYSNLGGLMESVKGIPSAGKQSITPAESTAATERIHEITIGTVHNHYDNADPNKAPAHATKMIDSLKNKRGGEQSNPSIRNRD